MKPNCPNFSGLAISAETHIGAANVSRSQNRQMKKGRSV